MSLEDLAAAVKIPVAKLEQVKLTFKQLSKIGKYFGYGALFFLDQRLPQEDEIHSLTFRTLANQKIAFDHRLNKLVTLVEAQRDLYLGLMEDLDEEHEFELPDLSGSVKDQANSVRNWLGLDDQQKHDFDSYRKLLEAKGILVFLSMGHSGEWKVHHESLVGFSMMHDTAPTIFIRRTTPERQTFTLFHELGHLFLHRSHCIDDEENLQSNQHSKQEQEANQFAALCLLPDKLLAPDIEKNLNPESYSKAFKPLAKQLGISVEVIVVGLLKRSRVTADDYGAYKNITTLQHSDNAYKIEPIREKSYLPTQTRTAIIETSTRRTYKHLEPRRVLGDKCAAIVLDAYHADIITLHKACVYLNCTVDAVDKLSKSYAHPN